MEDKIPKSVEDAGYEIYCDAEKLGSLDIPIVDFEIENLIWNFDLPLWGTERRGYNLTPWDVINKISGSETHQKRVRNTDTQYPILIIEKNGKWLIIDGVHRLVKAYEDNQTTIRAKVITQNMIDGNPWTSDSININQ